MKILNLLLVGFLLGSPGAVQAQFDFSTNNGTITITGYTGTNGNVIIPAAIDGYPVTGISGFYSAASLTNIIIPASVTNIADSVFANWSSLTAITVEEQNLYYSSLNGVLFDQPKALLIQAPGGLSGSYAIPDSVTGIGYGAFLYCAHLTNITMPNSTTNLGSMSFEGCSGLTNIMIGTNVTTIGHGAFAYCSSLTSITIPGSVTNIVATSMGLVGIGMGVRPADERIEMVAGCDRLTTITVDPANPSYSSSNGILFNKLQTALLEAPGGFVGSYIVPSQVTRIGPAAFQNCARLTSVAIPTSVTNIGTAAFASCGSLAAITVDGENMFYRSSNGILFNHAQTVLIQFPGAMGGSYAVSNGVVSLGSAAFSGCSNLTSITIPGSVTNVGSSTFDGCLNAGIFFAGNAPGITSAGLFPILIRPIFGNGFYNPKAQAVYYLPGTTGWGATFFAGIPAYLWIPPYVCTPASNSITINGYNGSGGAITIPEMINGLPVTTIASGAFDNAGGFGLTNILIGSKITAIGDYAFAACANLTSITIPSGVTNIGTGAFLFCDKLNSVYFQGNAPTVGVGVFFHWSGIPVYPWPAPIYVPPTPTTVYYLPGTTGWGATFGGQPAVLWNPQAQTSGESFGVRTNGFGFNIIGATNLIVRVEASTNLSSPDWQPVQTLTLTAGTAYFSDPQWTNYPGRVYRLCSP